jgi:hypothetical protein
VLRNIDLSQKGEDFWYKLSGDKVAPFVHKEFVVLRCKDRSSAKDLAMSIPEKFADTIAFANGIPIYVGSAL